MARERSVSDVCEVLALGWSFRGELYMHLTSVLPPTEISRDFICAMTSYRRAKWLAGPVTVLTPPRKRARDSMTFAGISRENYTHRENCVKLVCVFAGFMAPNGRERTILHIYNTAGPQTNPGEAVVQRISRSLDRGKLLGVENHATVTKLFQRILQTLR